MKRDVRREMHCTIKIVCTLFQQCAIASYEGPDVKRKLLSGDRDRDSMYRCCFPWENLRLKCCFKTFHLFIMNIIAEMSLFCSSSWESHWPLNNVFYSHFLINWAFNAIYVLIQYMQEKSSHRTSCSHQSNSITRLKNSIILHFSEISTYYTQPIICSCNKNLTENFLRYINHIVLFES